MKSLWMCGQEYKPIKTHPLRFVSAMGRVISLNGSRGVLKLPRDVHGQRDDDGYLFIKNPKTFIHHAVLLSWGIERPEGAQVRHLNGIKTDNRLCNLAWGTAKENGRDRSEHGSSKGEKNHRARMSEEIVLKLRSDYVNKPLAVLVVENPEYSKFAIWAAVSGYTWCHLPGAIPKTRKCSKEGWRNGQKIRQ